MLSNKFTVILLSDVVENLQIEKYKVISKNVTRMNENIEIMVLDLTTILLDNFYVL